MSIASTNSGPAATKRPELWCSSFYRDHCIYLPAMLGWFLFSALLSAYNKQVFGQGYMGFPCPLLLTSIHFGVQWLFSWCVTTLFPITLGGDRVHQMSWGEYLSVSIPCGLVTSADVGMSNLALVRITITFYTMVKASTPVFVMIWAYMFGIERITLPLLIVVATIAVGEFLTVIGETEFDLLGFTLCLSASCLSGARWTLVQLKIQSLDPPLKTTLATMRVLSPSMFLSMLIVSLIVEKPWNFIGDGYVDDPAEVVRTISLGLLGAVFAIAMVLCEFSLIMKASAIVLMIGGVIKEMVNIVIGVYVFQDILNRINIWGCFTVFLGVVFYKVQYHLSGHGTRVEEGGTMAPKGKSQSHYRQVKDHFSDDEGESGRFEMTLDDLDGLLNVHIPVENLSELEMTQARRLSSGSDSPLSVHADEGSIGPHTTIT